MGAEKSTRGEEATEGCRERSALATRLSEIKKLWTRGKYRVQAKILVVGKLVRIYIGGDRRSQRFRSPEDSAAIS